jgi:hypothetical protein
MSTRFWYKAGLITEEEPGKMLRLFLPFLSVSMMMICHKLLPLSLPSFL